MYQVKIYFHWKLSWFFFSFEDYMNYNDLTALQRLSQLTPSALSALTQLAASSFPGLNSLAGLFRDLI